MKQLLSNNPEEDIAPVSPFGSVDYGISEAELQKLAKSTESLTTATNRAEYDAVREAIANLRSRRVNIEDRRKNLGRDALEFKRLVDATGKDLIAIIEPEEKRLTQIKRDVDDEKRRKKEERERIEKARVDAIEARIDGFRNLPIKLYRANSLDLNEAIEELNAIEIGKDFAEFADKAAEIKDHILAELRELWEGAIHDERVEARQKAEQERLDAERQKLEAEREAQEAALRAEREAEARKVAEERQKLEAEKAALESERLAREQAERQAEADAEVRERAERELKEAEARAKAMRPDYEKLRALLAQLNAIEIPELETPEARVLANEVYARIVCSRDILDSGLEEALEAA